MCSENQFKSIQFILINTYKYIYTFIYTELNNNNSCLNVFYTVRTLRYSGESVNNQIIFYEEALLSGGKEELPCNRKKPPAETGTGRSHPQPHPPTMREKEKENTAEDLSIAGFSLFKSTATSAASVGVKQPLFHPLKVLTAVNG